MRSRFLTANEAAEYLGLSTSYLAKLRMDATSVEGPNFVRVGKRAVRYPIKDLDAWMENRAAKSKSEGCGYGA